MHMKVSVRQLQVAMQAGPVEPKVSLKCTGRRLTQSKERGGTTHEGVSIGRWDVQTTSMGWNHAAGVSVARGVRIMYDGGDELYNVHPVLGVHHHLSLQLQLPDPSSS
jgi:hypothetical protein